MTAEARRSHTSSSALGREGFPLRDTMGSGYPFQSAMGRSCLHGWPTQQRSGRWVLASQAGDGH